MRRRPFIRLRVLTYGAERVLAPTEKPANIVRRRLEQAGYDEADGLEQLGADDLSFLMKFEYKSNVLGPLVRSAFLRSIPQLTPRSGG